MSAFARLVWTARRMPAQARRVADGLPWRWALRPLDLDIGRAVPGWLVRVVPAAEAGAAVALVAPGSLATWLRLAWIAAAVVLLLRAPAGGAAGGVLLTVGLAQLAHRSDLGWRTSVLVLLLHGTLALALLAGHVAWRARVEVRVLADLGRQALPAQVVAQLLLWALAVTGTATAPHPWLRLLALAAITGLALGVRAVLPGGRGWPVGRRAGS